MRLHLGKHDADTIIVLQKHGTVKVLLILGVASVKLLH